MKLNMDIIYYNNSKFNFHDSYIYSLSIERASAPSADVTHPDTKGETFDNLLRKILSSRLTN